MHILKFTPNDHNCHSHSAEKTSPCNTAQRYSTAQGLDTYYQLTYSNHKMQLKITSTDSLEWDTYSKLASAPKEKNYA